jgi:hypothetical protein
MQIDQTTLLALIALIALIALVISICGFLVSIWSAVISHKALNHNRNSYEEQQKIAFERERSQLLEIFNDSRKLLDQTRIEIGALKAQFDAEPETVKALLVNYTNLFSEYLPTIERGLLQNSLLWDEVAGWKESTGIQALVHHQAKFKALVHNDQVAHDQGLYCVNVFKAKLKLAKEKVAFDLALENPIIAGMR